MCTRPFSCIYACESPSCFPLDKQIYYIPLSTKRYNISSVSVLEFAADRTESFVEGGFITLRLDGKKR